MCSAESVAITASTTVARAMSNRRQGLLRVTASDSNGSGFGRFTLSSPRNRGLKKSRSFSYQAIGLPLICGADKSYSAATDQRLTRLGVGPNRRVGQTGDEGLMPAANGIGPQRRQ